MTEHVKESAEATRLAGKAVRLGGEDSVALCMGGYALAFVAQEFDDGGDSPSGYSATKGVVGKKCFRPISVTIHYDRGRRESSRSIDGGEFISREEFEAEPS